MFRFALRANVILLACFCLLAVAGWLKKIASRFARMLFHLLDFACLLLLDSVCLLGVACLLVHACFRCLAFACCCLLLLACCLLLV